MSTSKWYRSQESGSLQDASKQLTDDADTALFRRVGLMYSSVLVSVQYFATGLIIPQVLSGHQALDHPERYRLEIIPSRSEFLRPERVTTCFAEMCRTGLIDHCIVLPARRANLNELELCHDGLYTLGTLVLRRNYSPVLSVSVKLKILLWWR